MGCRQNTNVAELWVRAGNPRRESTSSPAGAGVTASSAAHRHPLPSLRSDPLKVEAYGSAEHVRERCVRLRACFDKRVTYVYEQAGPEAVRGLCARGSRHCAPVDRLCSQARMDGVLGRGAPGRSVWLASDTREGVERSLWRAG